MYNYCNYPRTISRMYIREEALIWPTNVPLFLIRVVIFQSWAFHQYFFISSFFLVLYPGQPEMNPEAHKRQAILSLISSNNPWSNKGACNSTCNTCNSRRSKGGKVRKNVVRNTIWIIKICPCPFQRFNAIKISGVVHEQNSQVLNWHIALNHHTRYCSSSIINDNSKL